jgi:hypothetical protein
MADNSPAIQGVHDLRYDELLLSVSASSWSFPTVRLALCQLSTDSAHFLSCQSFRRGPVTHRHNSLTQCLARLVRRSGGSAYIEPSWFDEKRPDIHVTYPDARFLVDGNVAHPGAPIVELLPSPASMPRRHVKLANSPNISLWPRKRTASSYPL